MLGIGVDAEVLVLDGALRVVPDPVQIAPILRLPGVGAFRRTIEGAGLRLELPPRVFSSWLDGAWVVPPGGYQISVGRSSRDHQVTGALQA